MDKDDRASRVERGPYWVIYVVAYVPWLLVRIIYFREGGLTGFVPRAVRRRDSNPHRAELVKYIRDKLERP